VPEVIGDGPVSVHRFIQGRTLGAVRGPGSRIRRRHFGQLLELYRSLARYDTGSLADLSRIGSGDPDRAGGGDSTAFLLGLIEYTDQRVYRLNRREFGRLFAALGVPDDALARLAKDITDDPLTPRPYILLHGDLHRENLIVDLAGDLWAIDWELAGIGDPLYDLATHLHLMRYPGGQGRRMVRRWAAAVSAECAGAAEGAMEDLPKYLAYKRVQSVYTDVLRAVRSPVAPADRHERLHAARPVRDALVAAADALLVDRVPTLREIESVLAHWMLGGYAMTSAIHRSGSASGSKPTLA
jgi:hypothetical protein